MRKRTIWLSSYRNPWNPGWDLRKFKGSDWGYSDDFVVNRAREEWLRLLSEEEPFVLFVETVDTHFGEYCPKEYRKFGDTRDPFVETDSILTAFVSEILAQNAKGGKQTNVVLVGDHPLMGQHSWLPPERIIYNAFFGDIPKISEAKKAMTVSALDIAPSILQAAGAKWAGGKWGLGVSFFSDEPSLIQKLGEKELNAGLAKHSRFFDGLY